MSRPFTPEIFHQKWKKSPTGCWEWQATKNEDGYGRVKVFGTLKSAHRVSYELAYGPFPKELHVCHSCDNPGCVNPEHLWLGTHKQNQEDIAKKKRAVGNSMPGETHPSHKLTTKQILDIFYDPRPDPEIAKEYGVSSSLIAGIQSKKRWKHLTSAL